MVQNLNFYSEKLFWSSPKSVGIPKMKLDLQNIDSEFTILVHKNLGVWQNSLEAIQ